MKYLVDIDPRIKLSEPDKALDVPAHVTFTGAFTEASAKKFRDELEAVESHCLRSQQDIIPIVIDSYGGSVYALLSMVDTIENCKVPVATIVESKAMSCGAVLFSCGAEGHRYMGPRATVLIHDVSSHAFGKEPELKVGADEASRLNQIIYEMMAENCGHKNKNYFYDKVTEKRGADWFLTPEESLEHNLANHIAIPEMKIKLSLDWSFGLSKD